jgi:hypothetical protein
MSLSIDNATTALLKNPENKTETKFASFVDSKNRKLSLSLECESLGGIISGDYGQSVLLSLLNETQKDEMNAREDELEKAVPETFHCRQFLRDDRFFMKLQIKDGNYKALMVPRQNCDEPEKSSFANGEAVVVECKPGAYFNFKEKTCGLYLQITKITIGKPKSRKR